MLIAEAGTTLALVDKSVYKKIVLAGKTIVSVAVMRVRNVSDSVLLADVMLVRNVADSVLLAAASALLAAVFPCTQSDVSRRSCCRDSPRVLSLRSAYTPSNHVLFCCNLGSGPKNCMCRSNALFGDTSYMWRLANSPAVA